MFFSTLVTIFGRVVETVLTCFLSMKMRISKTSLITLTYSLAHKNTSLLDQNRLSWPPEFVPYEGSLKQECISCENRYFEAVWSSVNKLDHSSLRSGSSSFNSCKIWFLLGWHFWSVVTLWRIHESYQQHCHQNLSWVVSSSTLGPLRFKLKSPALNFWISSMI